MRKKVFSFHPIGKNLETFFSVTQTVVFYGGEWHSEDKPGRNADFTGRTTCSCRRTPFSHSKAVSPRQGIALASLPPQSKTLSRSCRLWSESTRTGWQLTNGIFGAVNKQGTPRFFPPSKRDLRYGCVSSWYPFAPNSRIGLLMNSHPTPRHA